jgi:hypothetical protein
MNLSQELAAAKKAKAKKPAKKAAKKPTAKKPAKKTGFLGQEVVRQGSVFR